MKTFDPEKERKVKTMVMRKIREILKKSAVAALAAVLITTSVPAGVLAEEVTEDITVATDDTAGSENVPEDILAAAGDTAESENVPEDTTAAADDTAEPEEVREDNTAAADDTAGPEEVKEESDEDEPSDEKTGEKVSENKVSENKAPAFEESKTIGDVTITVSAEEGIFPEDAELSVKKADMVKEEQAEEAVNDVRDENVNVAASYTYDIKVLDKDGGEIEPEDESKVHVSFTLDEVADENLSTNIYHITESDDTGLTPIEEAGGGTPADEGDEGNATDEVLNAEQLPVETDGTTVTAETDGFSLYTVEFTYENKQYVMPGDGEIPLSTILDTVGLTGEVTDVRVSDEDLFSASDETGEWIVTAHKAFSSNEWMKVRINGVDYEITVTDDQGEYNISGGSITINSSNKGTWDNRVITGTINKANCEANETSFFNKHGALNSSRAAIIIDGTEVNLKISNLNITATCPESGGYAIMVSPILLKNGAKLNLTIEGTNTLTACWGGAGICVPGGCTLNISGNGTLNATGGNDGGNSIDDYSMGGAGIGMCQYLKESELGGTLGNITISGGTITAQGGSQYYETFGASGIGGSEGTTGGVIKITGGNVTAKGGSLAAGIGGGGSGTVDSITISGGTVKATGGKVQGGSDAHFVGGTFIEIGGSSLGSTAIGCGYEGSQDHRISLPAISITGGNVTAEGNIGCPDVGYYSSMGSLTVSDPNQVSCTGRITCPGYVNPEFTVTLYGTGISEGTGECGFRIGNESTYKPCNYSVTSDGAGKKLTVKTTRIIQDAESVEPLVAHIKIGNVTYNTASATLSKDRKEQALYSGYLCTLSGAVYDTGMPDVATGTVEIEGVTPEASSVSVSGSKATVSATFSLPEDGSLTDEGSLTKKVTIKIGNKSYQLDDMTFERSAAHKKKAEFSHNANGYSYIDEKGVEKYKKDNEVTVLDGSRTALGTGWYAVPAGQTIELKGESVKVTSGSTIYNSNYPVNINGDVHLILCDGSTADAKCGINVKEGNSLTIYGQSKGTGKLKASDHPYNMSYGYTAIGSGLRSTTSDPCYPAGNITICGGMIEAVAQNAPAIGGGYHGIGGKLTITGGKINAKVERNWNIVTGINAIGGYYYTPYSENGGCEGDVILSWNDPGMELYTSAFHAESKTKVNFQKTFVLKDSPETVVTRANMGGKTIVPGVKITFDKGELSGSMAGTYGKAGGSFTLPECGFTIPDGSNSKFAGWRVGNDDKVLPAGTSVTLPGNTDSLTLTAVSKPLYIIEGYTAEGAKIKATGTSDSGSFVKVITIDKPSHEIYGDGKSAEATISGDTDFLGTPGISYYKGSSKLDAAPTGAGTYIAKITLGEGTGAATASVEYTIAPKRVTITGVTVSEKEYDGTTEATPVMTSALIDGKVGNDNVNIVTGTAEFSDANVGDGKTVTFSGFALSGRDAGNYELISQPECVTANITKRSVTITAKDQSVELNGSIATGTNMVSVTSGSLVDGHAINTVTLTSSSTAAITDSGTITPGAAVIKSGTADVTAKYNITYQNGTLTVTKIKAVVTKAPTAKSLTYSGLDQTLVEAGIAAGGTLKYSLTSGSGYAETLPERKDAGTYTVYYKVFGDDNHEDSDEGQVSVTIKKKAVTVKADNKEKIYGESDPVPAEYTATETGLIGTGTVSYSISRATGENVGTYDITPAGESAQGNYSVTFEKGVFTIKPKTIANPVIGLSEESFTYDGKPKEPAVTVKNGDDEIPGKEYNVSYSNNINAGTATAAVTSVKNGNYSFSGSRTFTINKRDAVVTACDQIIIFGESLKTGTKQAVLADAVAGHSLSRVNLTADGSTAGEHTITASGAAISDASGKDVTANYNITCKTGKLTVNKAGSVITKAPSAKDLTYNGGDQTLTEKGTAAGGTLKYSLTSGSGYTENIPVKKDAGTYTVYYKVFGDSDHYDSEEAGVSVTIKRAAVTVRPDEKEKLTGEEDPELTAAVTGIVEGESDGLIKYTLSRESGEDAGKYEISASGEETQGNYSVKYDKNTFYIYKKSEETLSENTIPNGTGKIESKVVTYDTGDNDGFAVSDVTIPAELAAGLLNETEKQAVEAGETLTVTLEIKEKAGGDTTGGNEEAKAEAKEKAEAEVKKSTGNDVSESGMMLDIKLYKQVGNGSKQEIEPEKGTGKIAFTIEVPVSMRNDDEEVIRTFFVVHIYDDGRVEIASSGTDTTLPVETDRLSSWYLTYEDQKKDNSSENEEGKTDDNTGSSNDAAEKKVTVSDNKPMDYRTETKGSLRISYCHELPFWGKSKAGIEVFGEKGITVSVNNATYKVTKVKINKKNHRFQITGLSGADKKTEREIKKATKGSKGLSYKSNPYYVRNTDSLTVKWKKNGSPKSVKVMINGKDYKAKKEEWSYNGTSKTFTFKGSNLTGSYASR